MVKEIRFPWIVLVIGFVILIGIVIYGILRPIPGDVNTDGHVTIADYTMIRLERLELRQLTAAERKRADVNHDGKINNGDITMIKTMILEAQ